MTQSQAVTHEFEIFLTGDRIAGSVFALVVYEYATTFDQEIACVWQRKITATSLLLLSTRWVMLLNQLITLIPKSVPSRCGQWNTAAQLVYFTSVAQIALFSSMRVYALWNGSRFRHLFFAIVLTLGCIPIATNSFGWARTSASFEGPPISTCVYNTDVSDDLNRIMLYFTRCSAIAADLLVLILTWINTFAHWRRLRRFELGTSISTLLLRDGTLYFIVLLAPNISQILTYSTQNVNGASNAANNFLQGMPSLLVQRFMLNLRQFNQLGANDQTSGETPPLSRLAVRFRVPSDILGNIGEPLVSLNESNPSSSENELGTLEEQRFRGVSRMTTSRLVS